jgi:hypothetical protein
MDPKLLRDHLALAERHAAEGEDHIERQRRILAELERDGHDTALARKLLATLEATQAQHVANRDRLRRELEAGERAGTPSSPGEIRR